MDGAVQLEALAALEIMGTEGPVSGLLLRHAVRSRIIDAAASFCYPGGDIIAAPLPQPGAPGVDAFAAKFAFQWADLLLAHHIGYLGLVAGLIPDPVYFIDVDINLGDGSYRNYDLPRPRGQSSADTAGLPRSGGGIDQDNSMIAMSDNIIDCVQHPVLIRPQRGIREVVKVHDILDDGRRLIKPRQRIDQNQNRKIKIAERITLQWQQMTVGMI